MRGCIKSILTILLLLIAAGVAYTLFARGIPDGAPIARMYRAETDIASLVRAVDTYRASTGVYPPPGGKGLLLATRLLSEKADYFPQGPPLDPWGRPYVYVPHTKYGAPEAPEALRDQDGAYHALDTCQIYSLGDDGPAGMEDTINNWDHARSWRPLYKERNKDYMRIIRKTKK